MNTPGTTTIGSNIGSALESESWIDDMLAIIAKAAPIVQAPPRARIARSLRTQRRAEIVWNSRGFVKLLFSAHAYAIISEEAFNHNYVVL